jgi:ribosomal protein S18 acetylase RimI-like enzyme
MHAAPLPLPPGLPDFPAGSAVQTPALLAERGFFLRRVVRADLPWLLQLYASTRAEEMAAVPWPEQMKAAFIAEQFALQHRHYVTHFSNSDFLALYRRTGDREASIGRYYFQHDSRNDDTVDAQAPAAYDLLVDISLFPQWRNHGLGRLLIEASQHEARAQGRGMRLHVLKQNIAARRLYERLGFAITQDTQTHLLMSWFV